jgi:hypothetical protein
MMTVTRANLIVDRDALILARTSLLTGQTVKEYWRDGRKVVYDTITVVEINGEIDRIDDQIRLIDTSAGTARPRFRALSVMFGGHQ